MRDKAFGGWIVVSVVLWWKLVKSYRCHNVETMGCIMSYQDGLDKIVRMW